MRYAIAYYYHDENGEICFDSDYRVGSRQNLADGLDAIRACKGDWYYRMVDQVIISSPYTVKMWVREEWEGWKLK